MLSRLGWRRSLCVNGRLLANPDVLCYPSDEVPVAAMARLARQASFRARAVRAVSEDEP